MNWLIPNLNFVTISGSQSYGMNTSLSDTDIKGIALPPRDVREDLFHKFDQAINHVLIEEKYGYLKNPNNPKFESTIYSLSKFIQLASQVNPNIIENLYADSSFIYTNKVGEELIQNRDIFLSTKAKFTFSGYAFAQAGKIERHRKWIVKGILKEPLRADYGLPELVSPGMNEIERIVKKDIENWNFSRFHLEDMHRQELKETVWECVMSLVNSKITWDNWPQKYEEAALTKFFEEFNISAQITQLIQKEIRFKNDMREYQNWKRWMETRNLDRKNLEVQFLYDTKHGAHLIRLMRMGCEILETGKVITNRPDAKELLSIRNGAWTYDKLMEEFHSLNSKIDFLYSQSKLPKSVNYVKINELYQKLVNIGDSL